MSSSRELARALHEWAEVFMGRSIQEFVRLSKTSGLSMPQVGTLMSLYHGKMCGVSDVGADMGVTNAAASQMVDRLVQLGLLARVEDPDDRRAKRLTLTRKGREFVQQSIEARMRWLDELSKVLTPERQAAIIAALGHLTEATRKIDLAAPPTER